jgi:SET domain-containing protein
MKKSDNTPEKPKYKVVRGLAGLGLQAAGAISEDEKIIEYIGPHVKWKTLPDKPNQYLMELNKTTYIDGSARENIARYVNHSCDPNAYLLIQRGHAWIFAARAIDPGEEITFDYGEEFFDEYIKPKGCRCAQCQSKKV